MSCATVMRTRTQQAIYAYYRMQLTSGTQVGPTLEVIFDPVGNSDEDTVCV